jgi:hypothetical protein
MKQRIEEELERSMALSSIVAPNPVQDDMPLLVTDVHDGRLARYALAAGSATPKLRPERASARAA